MVPLINHGEKDFFIAKGTRVAQGIFYKYLTVDGDSAGVGAERTGGFGSTGK
jgi:dUTP pyrophosphatase